MKDDAPVTATIKTERPAAAPFNGMACTIVRKVEAGDVSFYNQPPQVVVLVDGRELQFFADEVIPDEKAKEST